jgi:hypothetical protein
MQAGRRTWLLLACLFLSAGCRRNELVENELRTRDQQYREAVSELNRTEAFADSLRRENEALRRGEHISPEQAANTYGVRKIVLGRGTTGVDNDSVPGDEALQVWLEPRDSEDHTIKAPGVLQIAVFEINSQGQKVLLSAWDVDEDTLRKSWKQGLLSVGYMVQFPWKVPPRTENLRVLAKLILPDGRAFETDKDIKVRLQPGAAARPEVTYPADPFFKSVPICPVTPSSVRPVSNWQPEPLHKAIQLGPPTSAPPPSGPQIEFLYQTHAPPSPDEIRLKD